MLSKCRAAILRSATTRRSCLIRVSVDIKTFASVPTAVAKPVDAGDSSFGRAQASSAYREGRFYQRSLPTQQIPFSSDAGKAVFREALASGHMESFFYLSEQFTTQDEPTFCGLATLAMVLNSLRIDPMRAWKGVWRWYNEHNLGLCSRQTSDVRERGLSFDMFTSLANCNGAKVFAQRAPIAIEETSGFADYFRSIVKASCCSSEREFIVVCYSRETLGQTGAGHFSPIGGYHEETDSVLIMDVARFKYPPHWVPLEDVVKAMQKIEPELDKPRGFLHLRAHPGADDPRHRLKPLHVPYVPQVAAQQLADSLRQALSTSSISTPDDDAVSWKETAVLRWLRAASMPEAQVLREVFQVGDSMALDDVISRMRRVEIFGDLCDTYAKLVDDEVIKGFPACRFPSPSASVNALAFGDELSLENCGELWVLMLMLLPQHLRSAVAAEMGDPQLPVVIAKAVRCPWALPMEALRTALELLLDTPNSKSCGSECSCY